MAKKITECFDQWSNLPTYVLADELQVDEFESLANSCKSLDDLEDKVRCSVGNCLNSYQQQANCLKDNESLHLMLLMSISSVDVEQLVQRIIDCMSSKNVQLFKLENRINKIYNLICEKGKVNERGSTSPHEGDLFAFNVATKFDKDDVNVDSSVDTKNKKDAWTLRLVYNDSTQDELSLVKDRDDADDYTVTSTSKKDKLSVKFKDDDKDNKLKLPQEVIDHIAKHISDAEEKNNKERKNQDADLAKIICFEIQKNFPGYNMEVIDDSGKGSWRIEIVYPEGKQDSFFIMKMGPSYIMKSNDGFIAKFTLAELKEFPKKLADHIQSHIKNAKNYK